MNAEIRQRHYGIYRGKVTHTNDPTNKHRIRATIGQLFGTAVTGWIDACVPPVATLNHSSATTSTVTDTVGDSPHNHTVTVSAHTISPTVGQTVWIMFEDGDPDFPVWIGIAP